MPYQGILKSITDRIRVLRRSKEEDTEKKKEFTGECAYCGKVIEAWNDKFYCKYCNDWYCFKHRRRRSHECSADEKLDSKYADYSDAFDQP